MLITVLNMQLCRSPALTLKQPGSNTFQKKEKEILKICSPVASSQQRRKHVNKATLG